MRIHKMLLTLLLGLGLSISAQADDWLQPGHDYAEVEPPVAVQSSSGKVKVVELFWYGCPACYNAKPHVENWIKNKPEYVELVRLPAIFNNPTWALHAQAFYTAEDLGVLEDFHSPFFYAIHRFKRPMTTQAQIRQFFIEIGVSGEDFDSSFNSFSVQTRVRQAAELTRRYGISGVPTLAVNGRYLVDGPMSGTYEKMFSTVNTLAAREVARLAER